jgi:hypothetical protein
MDCTSCGAEVKGLICCHCGASTLTAADVKSELDALSAFHRVVAEQEDLDKRSELLLHGYLPMTGDALAEAATRCLALVEPIHGPADVDAALRQAQAAERRMDVIITRLKTGPDRERMRNVTVELEGRLRSVVAKKERGDRQATYWAIGCLGFLLIAGGGIAVLILRAIN